MINNAVKKYILLSILCVVVVSIGILLFNKLVFRYTHSDPKLNTVATSSISISMYFSQPIRSIGDVTIGEQDIFGVTIQDSSISIPIDSIDIQDDQTYTLQIKEIKSKWFNQKIDLLTEDITVKYVDFSDLSPSQQQEQVNKSNSGQSDDRFFTHQFPIVTDEYIIDVESGFDIKYITITFLEEVPDYDNNGAVLQLPNDVAEKYRNSAINLIKDRGGTPDNYSITYSNEYLNQKYTTTTDDH